MEDVILLRDIELLMKIGINGKERAMPQTVLVDIELAVPLEPAAETDDLKKTVDYRPIVEYLKQKIVPLELNTIEALAKHICQSVRYWTHEQHPDFACSVTVAIKKPEAKLALPVAYPSVRMSRHYSALPTPKEIIPGDKWSDIVDRSPLLFAGLGFQYFPDVLRSGFVHAAIQELRQANFRQSSPTYGNAIQRLSSFVLGKRDVSGVESFELDHKFSNLQALRQAAGKLYSAIGEINEFNQPALNAVCVHKYPVSEGGLTAHRDESCFRNLIFIFSLEGRAEFSVGHERSLEDAETFVAEPRSLIIMRAPRCAEEKDLRPMHAVGRVTEGRLSIMFRADVEGE